MNSAGPQLRTDTRQASGGSTAASARSLVVFRLEDQEYGLRLEEVERVLPMIEVSPLPAAPAALLGVINLHGRVVPVVDLRRRFGLPPRNYGLGGRLLVVRSPRRTLAMPVDDVAGVRHVPAEAIQTPEAVAPGLSQLGGVAALDGNLLFIQDLEAVLSADEEQQLGAALGEENP
jgi:purine-binding chemotaxis protein CheW